MAWCANVKATIVPPTPKPEEAEEKKDDSDSDEDEEEKIKKQLVELKVCLKMIDLYLILLGTFCT